MSATVSAWSWCAEVAGAPLFELRDVSKHFASGTLALDRLSLAVGQGEFVSLLGPSGCGKSTTLRMIAGLAAPSSGTIDWSGEVQQGDVGYVFQEPTLLPWATVFDNVRLPLRLRGVSRSRARDTVMARLDSVGLADRAGAYPRELSGGMKMRVSIARALVTKPRLLLLDEPFAALDEITRHRLNDDMLRLWGESGVTVVFVTHSVFESAYLSSRIVVMRPRPGRVHADLAMDSGERGPHYRTSEAYRSATERVLLALEGAIGAADA